jgi:hypothetical protein
MKYLVILFFLTGGLFSCDSDDSSLEPQPIYPRTEYHVGTSHLKEYILEIVLIDSMYQYLVHNTDTMFQDTLELVFEKVADEVQINIKYEDTYIKKTLDVSGNYYFFRAPKPTVETYINYDEGEKLVFQEYYTSPSPDQAGNYNNKYSFKFEGVKL